MRIGQNPNKDTLSISLDYTHQVIIPVYIPSTSDYFTESLSILKLCISSLLKSSHPQTFITIINNGCEETTSVYLKDLYDRALVHELIATHNIGKINAVFKGLTGHRFPLVTVTDSDVLFRNGWQAATYTIFGAFDTAGYVATSPNPKLLKYYTHQSIIGKLFSRKLVFKPTREPESLNQFAHSIGNNDFFAQVHKEKSLTLINNGVEAVLGAGHFCGTYKGSALYSLKNKFTQYTLGGDTDRLFLDQPIAAAGYDRFATTNTFTLHLGNQMEPWMHITLENVIDFKELLPIPLLPKKPNNKIVFLFREFLFKIISKEPFWSLFLKRKGLTAQQAKEY